MELFFLPQRCLVCGEPHPGRLCRSCLARFQPDSPPNQGLGRCQICGQVLLAEAGRCTDCSVQEWSFPEVDGLYGYQDPGGELLRLYKFGGQAELAEIWAESAAPRLHPPGPIVPVPPLRQNLWRRGWDPVATFSRALGKAARVPVWTVLTRRPSASQKILDRPGRQQNARRAYSLAGFRGRRVRGTPLVWLIDDVVTTGATVEACSRLLREAGAKEVRVFCLGLH